MDYKTTMTEGSIWQKMLLFCIPLVLGNVFQQLYSTVDSIIVGRLVGDTAQFWHLCAGYFRLPGLPAWPQ